MLIDAPRYLRELTDFVRASAIRRGYLCAFLANQPPQKLGRIETLPDSALAELVAMLAPGVSSDLARGLRRRGGGDNVASLIRGLIHTLEQRRGDDVPRALEALLDDPALESWHYMIRSAINTVRVARRSASLVPLEPREATKLSRTTRQPMLATSRPLSSGTFGILATRFAGGRLTTISSTGTRNPASPRSRTIAAMRFYRSWGSAWVETARSGFRPPKKGMSPMSSGRM